MITDINSQDRLIQKTFADHLRDALGWESVYAYNTETFGPHGFDNNLTDYLSDHSIAHAFHHNAFLVVSNGDRARYGSITSKWEHFVEWKRNEENGKHSIEAGKRPNKQGIPRPQGELFG